MNYLNERKNSGVLVAEWCQLEELYVKKLWHQLTLKVHEMVKRSELQQGNVLIDMYEKFISDFEHRINQLSLVEICLVIVRQYADATLALAFLDKLREKVKSEPEPRILCSTAMAMINLEQQKDLAACKRAVEQLDTEVSTELEGVTSVHARYYELASNYYKAIGDHSNYYKSALRYLGCIDSQQLPLAEQQERAFFLTLAAILGEGVYNFGELLMHPVLKSLSGTGQQWLVELLYAFNRGDMARFEALKSVWSEQADLKAAEVKMRQKICLLALMEMAFERPANNKQLTFAQLAAHTKLPEDEIELLVMRALSLGLVKGSIDQIDKKVLISWVQPRVLDLNQIKMVRARLDTWSTEVNKMIGQIQANSHEILT